MSFPYLFRSIAGNVIPGDDRDLSGLQAADFLSGELCSYTRKSEKNQFYQAMLKGKPLIQLAMNVQPEKLQYTLERAKSAFSAHEFLTVIFKRLKEEGVNLKNPTCSDFVKFNTAMSSILRADPAMEAGISNHVWSIEELVNLL